MILKLLKLFEFHPGRNWRNSLNRPRPTNFINDLRFLPRFYPGGSDQLFPEASNKKYSQGARSVRRAQSEMLNERIKIAIAVQQ